jgi:hypothetical protein
MNFSLRLFVLAVCLAVCGSGFTNVEKPPLTVSQLEQLVRRDLPVTSSRTRIEFGSVRVEKDAAFAQVVLAEENGTTRAFIYKLVPASHSWKVASTQRLWFVPPAKILRGLRI